MINLKNLCVKNGENFILKDINFSLKKGEKVAIIGENGAGKSTFLELIAGLREKFTGEIEIFDFALNSDADFAKIRHKIGFLFQNSDDQFIYPLVKDDVTFNLLANGEKMQIAEQKVEKILTELNILHLKDRVVYKLSGGEKKLVALAGALICEPEILLLDEPTAGLDFKMQKRLSEILQDLQTSLVIVSHDKAFLGNIVNKFYLLENQNLKIDLSEKF